MYAKSPIRQMRPFLSISWHNGFLLSSLSSSVAALSPAFFQRRMVTLGELAKAFSELGTPTASNAETAPISQGMYSHNDIKETQGFSLKENRTFFHKKNESPEENDISTEEEHSPAADKSLNKAKWHQHLFTTSTISSQTATQSLLNLSLAYARHLRSLSEVDLTAEVGKSYRCLNYGNMIQCLIEVWRRFDWLTVTTPTISTQFSGNECRYVMWNASPKFYSDNQDTTKGRIEGTTTSCEDQEKVANTHQWINSNMSLDSLYIAPKEEVPSAEVNRSPDFRTDHLLEGVLRCLCKMDLIELEPEICAWIEQHVRELHLVQGVEAGKVIRAQGPNATALSYTQDSCGVTPCGGRWAWELELPSSGVRCHYAYPWPAAFEFTNIHLTHKPIKNDKQQHKLVGRTYELSLPNTGTRFVHKLSEYLLQWLLMRVSSFDAEMSVTILHLVVQQRLLFSDALLETLADNIILGIQRLDMNRLSVLIDAIHRYQMSIINMSRWHNTGRKADDRHLLGSTGTIDPGSSSMLLGIPIISSTTYQGSSFSNNSSTQYLQAARTLRQNPDGHPIVNEWLYNSAVEQMIQLLSCHPQGDHAEMGKKTLNKATIVSAADFSGWSQISPTGFLFLTRALARITFFHPGLVPAMQPGLAAFLRQHPEPYLGIVLLLGRRENFMVDSEVVYVLLKNLTTMLERRRCAKSPVLVKRASDGAACMDNSLDTLNVAEHQDQNSVGNGILPLGDTSHALDPCCAGNDIRGDEEGEQQLMLLSDEYCHDELSFQGLVESGGMSLFQDSAPRYRVGLIDIYGLPTFLRSITRLFRLALKQQSQETSAIYNTECKNSRIFDTNMKIYDDGTNSDTKREIYQNITREALQRAMIHFLRLLYIDTHCGISSLGALEHDFPLVVVQRLLSMVLDTNKLMEELVGPTGPSAVSLQRTASSSVIVAKPTLTTGTGGQAEKFNAISSNDSISVLVSHVLVVELTYAWVRQIGCCFGKRQNHVLWGSPAWQQQVLHMVDRLQWTGVLKRMEYKFSGKLIRGDVKFQSRGHASSHFGERTVMRYVIPDEVLKKNQRVEKAVNQEIKNISQRMLARQPEKWDDSNGFLEDLSVSAPVLQSSAVFAPFSRVVNTLRRQEG
ncbi:unnamed protein product [Phytomonas sp. Hart1]|nr:unnamed protein product [Phytomonas sp. Hart1]|eukprot:CCW68866.1 unnamed protein product [Phytomonas sp. isolate Hart1]